MSPNSKTPSPDSQTPSPDSQTRKAGAAAPAAAGSAIPPAKRRRLQQCYEHARANLAKGNHEYASELFTQCLLGDPGSLAYAQSFLTNLHQKYNNNKKGGKLVGFKGAGSKASLKKCTVKKDWGGALKAGVELLKLNPWDTPTLTAMGRACGELHHEESQLYFLKMALDTNPKDAEINRLAGKALGKMGQFDQAIACWHRVEQADKDDEEARKMIAQLTVDRTIHRGGYDDLVTDDDGNRPLSGSSSNLGAQLKGGAAAEETESEEPDEPVLTPEERLEQAIADDPANPANYLELAELFAQKRDFEKAEQLATRGLEASGGGDLRICERVEDYQLRRHRQRQMIAEKQAQTEKTEEAIATARRVAADVNRAELEIYAMRAERHPGNGALRYEVGLRLKRAGKYNEAIQNLQQARGDAKRNAVVHLELGECFQHIKQYKLALSSYEQALADAAERNDETRKRALYRAAVLAMGLKDLDTAEKYFTDLAGLDFGYKDVAERLDKLARLRNDQ